ncbi:MAG: DUF4268 domain-containing protein [Aestuariivirga sp.]|nr:DUF4268 domain-containing protein [Aestuariivirga sp.]
MNSIGKLERVALREVWKHEAYDFTQWLQDNIDVLNEALNITLVNVDREQAAGSFSIDLVAEDEGGAKVIIENQLEKSNHDHLGKLITYLTALNARVAIWIVAEPRPEHVAAISWLNDSSSATFYLVKVEAVRIGISPPAPLLTVIVGPSDEKSEVAATNKEFAERYDVRQRWWEKVVEHPEGKLHAHITPGMYSWIGTSSGVRGLNLNYAVTQDECAAELYIDRGKNADEENKAIFDQLLAHKTDIEQSFGGPLSWERLDAKRACRIRVTLPGGYRSPEEEWEGIQTAMIQAMNRLERALRPHLKSLRIGS